MTATRTLHAENDDARDYITIHPEHPFDSAAARGPDKSQFLLECDTDVPNQQRDAGDCTFV